MDIVLKIRKKSVLVWHILVCVLVAPAQKARESAVLGDSRTWNTVHCDSHSSIPRKKKNRKSKLVYSSAQFFDRTFHPKMPLYTRLQLFRWRLLVFGYNRTFDSCAVRTDARDYIRKDNKRNPLKKNCLFKEQ